MTKRKRKNEPALEAKVKKEIRKLLDSLNAWHFMPMQNMGRSGIPDHIACVPLVITDAMVGKTLGVCVGIEAKRLNKEPTPRQATELEGITTAKGFAVVIDGMPKEPGSFNGVADALRAIFNAT